MTESGLLTVASYNVWIHAARNTARQVQLLRRQGVQVAGIQEVSEGVADPAVLDGERIWRLSDFQRGDYPHGAFGKAIDVGGGEYGNLVLSDLPLLSVAVVGLPREKGVEDRSILRVEIEVAGQVVSFYTTHLAWDSVELRARQVEFLKAFIDEDPNALRVLTGDFNNGSGLAELDLFLDGYRIVNASPGGFRDTFRGPLDPWTQQRAIDNIIVSSGVEVVDWAVIDSALSDHNPIKATLQVG